MFEAAAPKLSEISIPTDTGQALQVAILSESANVGSRSLRRGQGSLKAEQRRWTSTTLAVEIKFVSQTQTRVQQPKLQ